MHGAAQAPDLAIATYGETIDAAKRSAAPEPQSVSNHIENPESRDLLFTYVEIGEPYGRIAA